MCAGWLQWCHLLPTGGFQSTQRTVTFSRSSPPSLLPQGMSKSRCSLRAPRSDSMVSGGICTISPSVEKKRKCTKITATCQGTNSGMYFWPFLEQFVPSTMLDLAMKPDEAFKAPLNTTKLAPVTVEDTAQALTRDDSERPPPSPRLAQRAASHQCGSSQPCCWPESGSFRPRSGNTPGASRPPG